MATSYDEVKCDYLYLESVHIGGDMITIMDDVFELMATPTKKKAADMYRHAIIKWFDAVGSHMREFDGGIPESVLDDFKVMSIADKYGIVTIRG